MKAGVGVLFVALGLLVLWIMMTGRASRVGTAWRALLGDTSTTGVAPTSAPVTPVDPFTSSIAGSTTLAPALNLGTPVVV